MKQMIINNFQFGWLDSAYFDLTFIFGILALALISGGVVISYPTLFFLVLFLDLWLLGYHHVISTFTKLAGTREDRIENKFLIYILPIFVFAAVGTLVYMLGIWSIVTIYLFWQWFHYTRQSWGVSSFYKRKANIKQNHFYLDQTVFWVIPIWGILNRCSQGWDEFLFLPIKLPVVSTFLVDFFAVISFFSLLYWLFKRFKNYKEGDLSIGLICFELSHFCIFYLAYVFIKDINYGWLTINIWHNAQYILFVWLYNTNRFKQPVKASIVSWISQRSPLRAFVYFGLCLIVTSFFYGSTQALLDEVSKTFLVSIMSLNIIVFQTINFHHYIVDSLIWKARNKTNQKVMKVE